MSSKTMKLGDVSTTDFGSHRLSVSDIHLDVPVGDVPFWHSIELSSGHCHDLFSREASPGVAQATFWLSRLVIE